MINLIDRSYTVENGFFEILDKSSYWQVIYSNKFFKNSQYIMPTTFSKDFTYIEILHSKELSNFLSNFN